MTAAKRVGVIGGTFDPIHAGHLAAARAAQQALSLDQVIVVPASLPPHRPDKPGASGYHRLQMAALAVAGAAGWSVSDVELRRPGASYTFDTLTALKTADGGASRFYFILGADAFAEIATWSRYPAVLDLAHFVVIARPGTSLESLRGRLPELASRMSDPRAADAASRGGSILLLAAATPDVSSTEIRRRAAAGEPLDGLVPPAVRDYIAAHQLYRAGRSPESGADRPSGKPSA